MGGKVRHSGQPEELQPESLAQEVAELLSQAQAGYNMQGSQKGDQEAYVLNNPRNTIPDCDGQILFGVSEPCPVTDHAPGPAPPCAPISFSRDEKIRTIGFRRLRHVLGWSSTSSSARPRWRKSSPFPRNFKRCMPNGK